MHNICGQTCNYIGVLFFCYFSQKEKEQLTLTKRKGKQKQLTLYKLDFFSLR